MAPSAEQSVPGTQGANSTQVVPSTWTDANALFLQHPSAAVPSVGIVGLLVARVQQQPLGIDDCAVGAAVVALWLVQEWVVHRYLLHSSFEWAGGLSSG